MTLTSQEPPVRFMTQARAGKDGKIRKAGRVAAENAGAALSWPRWQPGPTTATLEAADWAPALRATLVPETPAGPG